MTDTYRAPSPAPVSPPPAPPREHPDTADTESMALSPPASPMAEAPSATPAQPAQEAPSQGEGERYVWQPPVPQFPPRPSQAPPVQYQGPQMQQSPAYAPQGQYVPQNQYAAPAPGPTAPQPEPPQPPQQQPGVTYGAPTYAPPTQVFAPPPSPGARRGRVGRRLARRAVRGMGGMGKLFSGGRLPLTALFLLLLGLVAWLGVDKISASHAPKLSPNAVSTAPIVLPPEADSVKTYLNATRADDVEGSWNALSATVKSDRLSQGDDKTVMKSYLDKLAQNNVVPTYKFVGAYGALGPNDFSKGGTYFYVQEVSLQGTTLEEPMTFIVDENGKISYVFDFLYHALAKVAPGLPPTK